MDWLTAAANWANIVGAIASVAGASLAYALWWKNRDRISAAFDALTYYYGVRVTVSELTAKLDKLSELRADDEGQRQEVIGLLADIHGQLQGNPKLRKACDVSFRKIHELLRDKSKLTFAAQRSVTAELRGPLTQYELHQLAERGKENI